jgi:hypothetical protein
MSGKAGPGTNIGDSGICRHTGYPVLFSRKPKRSPAEKVGLGMLYKARVTCVHYGKGVAT